MNSFRTKKFSPARARNAARLAREFAAEEARFARYAAEKEELAADSSLWPSDE